MGTPPNHGQDRGALGKHGQTTRLGPPSPGAPWVIRPEPAGVVGGIVPWNYPQTLASFKYAPAMAAGCTIVLKPSPETVLDSYVFAEAVIAADIPPGVVNIVPGGRE